MLALLNALPKYLYVDSHNNAFLFLSADALGGWWAGYMTQNGTPLGDYMYGGNTPEEALNQLYKRMKLRKEVEQLFNAR